MENNERIKQVNLELLKTFDVYCRKHQIIYRLEAGTLLGAIRHSGFIPWDDDVDIAMTRDMYDKFLLSLKEDSLPEDYVFMSPKDFKDKHFHDFTARIFYKGYIYREGSEYDNRFDGYYKYLWLDIFILDKCKEKNIGFVTKILKLIYGMALSNRYKESDGNKYKKRNETTMNVLEKIMLPIVSFIGFIFKLDSLFDSYDYFSKVYNNLSKDYIYYYSNYPVIYLGYKIEKELEEEYIYTKFEDTELPVPKEYDKVLIKLYGDYMTPVDIEKQVPTHENI